MPTTKENLPPITEPTKRAGHEIEKGWPLLSAHPLLFVSVSFIAFLLGFSLAWVLVVASKNATIETLGTANKEKDLKIEQLQKDNENLKTEDKELRNVVLREELRKE
jgi:uncharacterized protein YlxW (UPF0749 family)